VDLAEAHHWLKTFVEHSNQQATAELGRCLTDYAENLLLQGEPLRGREAARRSVEMLRALHDPVLPGALNVLADLETALGDRHASRQALEESVFRARQSGDDMMLAEQLQALAGLEMDEDNCEHSLALLQEAADLSHRGDGGYLHSHTNHSIALVLRRLGRLNEAHELMSTNLREWMHAESNLNLASDAEDYSALLGDVGFVTWIPVLLGAADAVHEHSGWARDGRQTSQVTSAIAAARATMNSEEWAAAYRRGRNMTVRDALQECINATTELDA
jgi:tetratricopeptide (TPR) repeat protein